MVERHRYIPTRYSSEKGDPGYGAWEALSEEQKVRMRVLLNGQKLDYVVMADSQAGVAKVYFTDKDGNLVCQGDRVKEETLRGQVVIDFEGEG